MDYLNITNKNVKFTILDDEDEVDEGNCFIEIHVQKHFLNTLLSILTTNNNLVDEKSIILTKREKQVLKCLTKGNNNAEIAKKLNVSVHTAKLHVHNILSKLSVQDRTEAAVKAVKCRLIDI
ncbi:MAG: response regulator transcription factor [Candidatus Gastranaerophilales bacterium]|nr:response regulator transcription factor [Candidatus Gastranaerophilales bacterium]